MTLKQVLDKFVNDDFYVYVNNFCTNLNMKEYNQVKISDYWHNYKDLEVQNMTLAMKDGRPLLCIEVKYPSDWTEV